MVHCTELATTILHPLLCRHRSSKFGAGWPTWLCTRTARSVVPGAKTGESADILNRRFNHGFWCR